jgi:uncharacterized protein with ParB-like and HNH nuclease domain
MSKLTNKIEANDRTVHAVLNEQKYTVDYFQREYSWGQKHIDQLVTDLCSAFQGEYTPGDARDKGEDYNNYYLGPFVVSARDGKRSIIDGQQRLTSLTLFLIYLNHLQRSFDVNEKIEDMIFSEHRGSKSFNIQVAERKACLEKLFNDGVYESRESDDASTINMAERYLNIGAVFPSDDFNAESLSFFIDWLKYNVVLVEIVAYSDDNAYVIFETMNDRGLNLTATEMLKGFVLSRFNDYGERERKNALWKHSMLALQEYDKNEDQRFFQSWLRAQYADSIRAGQIGSQNEDFEKIGTRFHSWVRENLEKMGLTQASGFESLMSTEFVFYLNAYMKIKKAEQRVSETLEHVYYIQHWGIAFSLSYPLMLAPLCVTDDAATVEAKINLVAKFIEIFSVKRSVNFKTFAASGIRYTMYSLVKEIRGMSYTDLAKTLSQRLSQMKQTWDGMAAFHLHRQNGVFIRFLLSRMTTYIEQQAGQGSDFANYHVKKKGKKPFEVEHILADKFTRHRDEFDREADFARHRNTIGGLVLLPRGTNQSYNDKNYAAKLPHYLKENMLAKSLCENAYQNNPNFLNMAAKLALPFKAHDEFRKEDMQARTALYQRICERIWAFDDPPCSDAKTSDDAVGNA